MLILKTHPLQDSMLTSVSSIQRCLHQVPLWEGAGLISPNPCPESPKSYREALWESCLAKSGPAQSQCFFCPQDLPVASRATPAFWNRTRGKKGAADPKDGGTHFQELPPSPPLSTGLLFPLHLALPGPPCRASLQGCQQPPASKAPRPS